MDSHSQPAEDGDPTDGMHLTPAEWQIAFDASTDGIAVVDRELRIVRANSTFASWCATSPKALHGRLCCDVLDHSHVASRCCPVRHALDTGAPARAECLVSTSQASYECRAYPVPAPDRQRARRAVVVLHHVTAPREARRALRRFTENAWE
ncbi:MAG: PAS domain-containing protein, partial [Anaerolineae bacterium]|nr:PAS domain-containing protein [Anaerolineae bacterium]